MLFSRFETVGELLPPATCTAVQRVTIFAYKALDDDLLQTMWEASLSLQSKIISQALHLGFYLQLV